MTVATASPMNTASTASPVASTIMNDQKSDIKGKDKTTSSKQKAANFKTVGAPLKEKRTETSTMRMMTTPPSGAKQVAASRDSGGGERSGQPMRASQRTGTRSSRTGTI
jgi:hypothetical protein